MSTEKLIDIYRKRDFGDLLQDSIRFVAWNAVPLLKAIVIFVGPLILISAILSVWFMKSAFGDFNPMEFIQNPEDAQRMLLDMMMNNAGASTGLVLISVLVAIAISVVRSAVVNSFIIRYGQTQTGVLDTQEMKEDVMKHALPYLGLSLLQGLLILGIYIAGALLVALAVGVLNSGALAAILGIGLVCFIIYMALPLVFNFFTRMYEGPNNVNAIRKGYRLIKGHWWQTFGLFVVLGLIALGVSLVLGLVGSIFAFGGGGLAIITLIWTFASAVLGALIYAVFSTAAALQYFNITGAGPDSASRIDDIGGDVSDNPFAK